MVRLSRNVVQLHRSSEAHPRAERKIEVHWYDDRKAILGRRTYSTLNTAIRGAETWARIKGGPKQVFQASHILTGKTLATVKVRATGHLDITYDYEFQD